ncbi:hypothetical protein M9H77_16131 [Catharanthus roseus]|uniref:Uncharacterized protein n=1 Tax=Catharanthus roseus TaxID=4058 RepID=A0ACC0B190_CATRO|nr:hypothetical protein M9H77_16131 [Catharanthus roseus]
MEIPTIFSNCRISNVAAAAPTPTLLLRPGIPYDEEHILTKHVASPQSHIGVETSRSLPIENNSYREMIFDATGPNILPQEETNPKEPPNPQAKKFFDMLKAMETLLVNGDDKNLVLFATAESLYIKSENQLTQNSVVLFYCNWFDFSDRGMRIHLQYKFIELHKGRRYGGYNPFVLAHQAEQVSFPPYPGSKRMMTDWLSVMKSQPRVIDFPVQDDSYQHNVDIGEGSTINAMIEDVETLVHDSCSSEELDIDIETYFEELQSNETENEWDSNEDPDEDADEDSDEDSDDDLIDENNEDSAHRTLTKETVRCYAVNGDTHSTVDAGPTDTCYAQQLLFICRLPVSRLHYLRCRRAHLLFQHLYLTVDCSYGSGDGFSGFGLFEICDGKSFRNDCMGSGLLYDQDKDGIRRNRPQGQGGWGVRKHTGSSISFTWTIVKWVLPEQVLGRASQTSEGEEEEEEEGICRFMLNRVQGEISRGLEKAKEDAEALGTAMPDHFQLMATVDGRTSCDHLYGAGSEAIHLIAESNRASTALVSCCLDHKYRLMHRVEDAVSRVSVALNEHMRRLFEYNHLAYIPFPWMMPLVKAAMSADPSTSSSTAVAIAGTPEVPT